MIDTRPLRDIFTALPEIRTSEPMMILACWTGDFCGFGAGPSPGPGPGLPVSTRKKIRAGVGVAISNGVDCRHFQEVISIAERRIGGDTGCALEERFAVEPAHEGRVRIVRGRERELRGGIGRRPGRTLHALCSVRSRRA